MTPIARPFIGQKQVQAILGAKCVAGTSSRILALYTLAVASGVGLRSVVAFSLPVYLGLS